MIPKPFDQIEQGDIQALIDNQVQEGKTLEYKRQLPGSSNDEKREFLTDVVSFANAAGGDIIYGVVEQRDAKGQPTGIPKRAVGIPGLNADKEIQRLENLIRDKIEPRIPGVRFRAIEGFVEGPILIIRIPQSWMPPHMVRRGQGTYRVFSRNSIGKYPLDVTEIRALFEASGAVDQRIQRIRDERLARIIADETPVPLSPNPKIVLHVISVRLINSSETLDPRRISSTLMNHNKTLYALAPQAAGERRYNFDGYLAHSGWTKENVRTYVQVFRDGYVETVDAYTLRNRDSKWISIIDVEREVIKSTYDYIELFHLVGVEPPFVVLLSFLDVKEYVILPNRHYGTRDEWIKHRIERNVLTFPDVVVEKHPWSGVDGDQEIARLMQPVFDALWQAAGWERSFSYDKNGNWSARRF